MKFKNRIINFYSFKAKKIIFLSLLSFLLIVNDDNKKCEISNNDFSKKK